MIVTRQERVTRLGAGMLTSGIGQGMNLFCNLADISEDVMGLYPHPTVFMSPHEESKLTISKA